MIAFSDAIILLNMDNGLKMGRKFKENIVNKVVRIALKKPLSYHEQHAYQASKYLTVVESERGTLPNQVIRECDDYAIEVLGDKKYAPWLYVYSAVAGKFKEGWIPDNFYGSQVVPNIKGHYGDCSYLKPLNTSFFQSTKFPDLGSYVNGLFLGRDYRIYSSKDFEEMLFSDCERIIFKMDQSFRGFGIHIFDRKTFNSEKIKILGNGVFQSFVEQHPLFNEFTPNSVATIRITTAVDDEGRVSARASYLRFGAENDTYVKSDSAIITPIHLATGTLGDSGYMPSWTTTPSHPASCKSFANVEIPNFQRCVDVVTSLHLKVPYVRCIGWDVTVNKEGEVVVLEWNGVHNGVKFTEATQGPSFIDLNWERYR